VAVASAGPNASLHLIPDNHASIPQLSFLQAGCPSSRPTNSIKALKVQQFEYNKLYACLQMPQSRDERRIVRHSTPDV